MKDDGNSGAMPSSNEGEQEQALLPPKSHSTSSSSMTYMRIANSSTAGSGERGNESLAIGGKDESSSPDQDVSFPLLEDDLTSSLLPPSPGRLGGRLPIIFHPENRVIARQLVRKMGDYVAYCTLLTMLFFIPLVMYRALRNRAADLAAYNSAGIMVCGTVILSLRLIYLHLTHWYMPEVQKYVVRILWMVPIYSIQSWLSLRFHESRIYIDVFRDFYEAYVIASFLYYLIELLGGQDALVQILLQKTNTQLGQHPWPLSNVLMPWELGVEFMLQCKHGVLQYVVFKVIASILTYFFGIVGMYGEGQFDWKVAYPYLAFFQNISVMYALYCLVMLYSAIKEELEHPVDWRPLGKFLCVKGVVFFTWWQGVVIFYLRAHGIIGNLGDWSSEDVAYGLIDYCIVIEMVGFAIAHSYTFTYQEYLPSNLPSPEACVRREPLENGDLDTSIGGHRRTSYRPPATLPHPMNFRDALWHSTDPTETIQDIQKLRAGIGEVKNGVLRTPSISLQEMGDSNVSNSDDYDQPPEQTLV